MQYIKCSLISCKTDKVDTFCVSPVRNSDVIFRDHLFRWRFMLEQIMHLLPTLSKDFAIGDDRPFFSLRDLVYVFCTDFRSLNNSVFVYFIYPHCDRPIYHMLCYNNYSYKNKLKKLLYSDTVLSYESNLSPEDKMMIDYVDRWNIDRINVMASQY